MKIKRKIKTRQKDRIISSLKKLVTSVLYLLVAIPLVAATITPGETPTLLSSAYTLVETITPTANSIILTQVNGDTGEIVGTKAYDLYLTKTAYTYGSGANTVAVNVPFSSTPITVKYDTALSNIVNSADHSGETISGLFLNATNSRLQNTGKIGTVATDFIGNTGSSSVLNNSTGSSTNFEIGKITGDFINNETTTGSIINNSYNDKIGEINSNFIGNQVGTGAIINNYLGKIGSITGDFIGNTGKISSRIISNNQGAISSIKGDFISNNIQGDAIIANRNGAYLGNISGNFIANQASATEGAIINNELSFSSTPSQIGTITATFVNNTNTYYLVNNNTSKINTANITAVNNTMGHTVIFNRKGTTEILNTTLLGNTSEQFMINNYSGTINTFSGLLAYNTVNTNILIHNTDGMIKVWTADLIGNTSKSNLINNNDGTLGDISANIINNTSVNGILFNNRIGVTGNITGDFIDNTSKQEILKNSDSGQLGNITGDFIGNTSTTSYLINNKTGTMGDISGDFTDNTANLDIIFNDSGTLGKLTGNFTGNTSSSGHLINNTNAVALGDIQGTFDNNTAKDLIHHVGTASLSIVGDFSNNTASNALLYNEKGTFAVSGDFSDNTAAYLLYNTQGASATFDNSTSSGTILDIYNGAEDDGGSIVTSKLTLNNSTLDVNVQNGGVLNLNNSSVKGITHSESASVSYAGITNITGGADFSAGTISNNTVNINNGTLTAGANTFNDGTVILNANSGSTINIQEHDVKVQEANFDNGSTLALKVNALSEYGQLEADTITVVDGANLHATLEHGIVNKGESADIQLLKATSSTDFNNFSDSFSNNIYLFEKKDKNGWYTITRFKDGADVAAENNGTRTNIEAAAAWIDGPPFSPASPLADDLNDLAQNDGVALLRELTALAPVDIPVMQEVASVQQDILLSTVSRHLRSDIDLHKEYVRVWAEVYGRKAKLSAQGKYYGFDDKHQGIIIGIDKLFENGSSLGLGFQRDNADIKTLQRKMNFETNTAFVYGEYVFGDMYTSGLLSYGSSNVDEKKQVLGTLYKDDYDAQFYGARALLGYEGNWFNPEMEIRYQYLAAKNYTDGIGQKVSKESMDILTLRSGLRKIWGSGLLRPEIYLGAGYDVLTDRHDAFVNIENGAGYRVYGQRLDRFSAEANLSLGIHFSNHLTLSVTYLGELRKHYYNNTGMIGLQYAFGVNKTKKQSTQNQKETLETDCFDCNKTTPEEKHITTLDIAEQESPVQEKNVISKTNITEVANFAFDSKEPRLNINKMNALKEDIQANPDALILVEGHTDNIGPEEYNKKLSLARANAVAKELAKYNYPNEIRTHGAGYSMPIASNDTKEGRAKNRRVDIVLVKDEQ